MEQRNHDQACRDDEAERIAELLVQAMSPSDRERLRRRLDGMLREQRKRRLRLIEGGKGVALIAFFGGISGWIIRALKEHTVAAATVGGAAGSVVLATAVWTTPFAGPAAPEPQPEVTVRMVGEPVGPATSGTPPPAARSGSPASPSTTATPSRRRPVAPPPAPTPAGPTASRDPVPTVVPEVPEKTPQPPTSPVPLPPSVPPLPLPTLQVPLPDPVPTILGEVCELPLDPVCDLVGQDGDAGENEGDGALDDLLGDVLASGQGARPRLDR